MISCSIISDVVLQGLKRRPHPNDSKVPSICPSTLQRFSRRRPAPITSGIRQVIPVTIVS
jgi:hypothetical protein